MREGLAFLLLACACGAATWRVRPDGERRIGGGSDARTDNRPGDLRLRTGADPADQQGQADRGGAAFASLERRASLWAPGLRQVAEAESGRERVELVRATSGDVCVRVAFEATAPVIARLIDGAAGVLAETQTAAIDGPLAEQGPVCIRKGDAVSAVAECAGDAKVRVKWIAWASP